MMNKSRLTSMAKRSFDVTSLARLRVAAGLAAIVGLSASAVTVASCTADEGARPIGNAGSGGQASNVTGGSNVDPQAPCVSGSVAECHLTVGTNEGILTCLHGERMCVGGSWGPCTGEFSSKVMPEGQNAQNTQNGEANGIQPLGLTDAGPCQNNPCDPYCQDYEEIPPVDGGYEVVPTITTVWQTGSFDDYLQNIPPGFVNKGITFPCSPVGSVTSDCEFDSRCLANGTNGRQCVDKGTTYASCCMPWNPGEYQNCSPVRPDFSAGLACVMSDGKKVVPICNRGNQAVPSGSVIRIHIWGGNAPSFPTCLPDKASADDCLHTLAQSLEPGKCVNADCSAYLPGNGNRTIMVNGPMASNGQFNGNTNYRAECSCVNNWTVWKGSNNNPCQPVQVYQANPIVQTLTYQGVCPAGTKVQWQYLTWDTTTPLDSSVVWKGRVATTSAGLGAASYVTLGTAKVTPTPDTHICSMAGPTGCPINLFNAFGGAPVANSEFLELEITMNPTSNLQQGAKVNNWQISYTCPPSQ